MAQSLKAIAIVASLACALLVGAFPTPVAADDVRITLSGSSAGGWGHTNASLSIPGPHLTVVEGDNVTLVLTSADGNPHDWFVDFDIDGSDDSDEPSLPGTFSTTRTWNFTARRPTGPSGNATAYVYRSLGSADQATMWGLITILPPGSSRPSPGPGAGLGPETLIVVGVVLAIAAAAFVAWAIARRRRMAGPPPPSER